MEDGITSPDQLIHGFYMGNDPVRKRNFLRSYSHALYKADTFSIHDDIFSWIEQGSATFPLDWSLEPTMTQTDSGLIWLPRKVLSGNQVELQGFLYNRIWSFATEAINRVDDGLIIHPFGICEHKRIDPRGQYIWPFGATIQEWLQEFLPTSYELANVPHEDSDRVFERWLGLFLGSFFTFLQEPLVETDKRIIPRALQRRASKVTPVDPVVRVIQLRSRQNEIGKPDGESTSVEWASRWVVRGHWRNQWYPSQETHKPVWIAPYVKGPDDKPLKPPRTRVFAVVR